MDLEAQIIISEPSGDSADRSSSPSNGSESLRQPPGEILVYDFFSGCGGTSAGLKRGGMTPVFALDFDREAAKTYEANFPDASFLCSDIRNVLTSDIAHLFEQHRTRPILFTACAPCQPFSRQNRQKRDLDGRLTLLTEIHRFVLRFRPEFLFIENVPGLKNDTVDGDGQIFSDLISLLNSLRYFYDYKIVKAADYGVPQNRRRLVLIASAFGPIKIPKSTNGGEEAPYRTVKQTIGHFPAIEAGETHPTIPNHRAASLSPLNLQRIRATPEGGTRVGWSESLKLDCHLEKSVFTDVYARMCWDKPAPALTTRCISLSNGRFGHPCQDRAISVREAAALQTFDDDFLFKGSLNGMARQIGNAVPVRLAEVFGLTFAENLRLHSEQS